MRRLFIFIVPIFTTGCIVFPTLHNIYEPTSSEGKLINPAACGYIFNNKVRLVIEKPDYKLETEAFTDVPPGKIKIFFRVVPTTEPIKIDFSKIHVMVNGGNMITPGSVTRHAYGKSYRDVQTVTEIETLEKKTNNFYYIEFSTEQPIGDEFVLIVDDSLSMDQKFLTVSPVTFKKAKKMDLYYGSINC